MVRERILDRIADRARSGRTLGQLAVAFRERGLAAGRRVAVRPFCAVEDVSALRDLCLGQYAGNVQHHDTDSGLRGFRQAAAARNASRGDAAR